MAEFIETDEKDIPLIQNLARKSWEDAYSEILGSAQIDYMLGKMYDAAELSAQMQNPDFQFFIIKDNDQDCGFIGFQKNFENDTAKLHKLYLLPAAKGKGVGKAAIDFLKNAVQGENSRIILAVNKENPAKNFYEGAGFAVYREAVTEIGNGYVMDDYLMEYRKK